MSLDENIDPNLGHEINGPGRQYFENVITDNLMDAIIEISATLWTVRDRQIVLEKILEKNGIDAADLIEAHIPTKEEKMQRAAEREEIVQRVFKSFLRRPADGVAGDADKLSLREIDE